MPADSFQFPQSLYFPHSHQRSQSPHPSQADPSNDIAISAHSPHLDVSRALSSRRSLRLGLPEQFGPVATGVPHPSALGNASGYQHSSRRPLADRGPDHPNSQHRPFNQVNVVTSPSPQVPSWDMSPSQSRSPYPLNPTHASQPVTRRYSPYQLGASAQRSSYSRHLMQPLGQYSQRPPDQNLGSFYQAQGFAAMGALVDGYVGTGESPLPPPPPALPPYIRAIRPPPPPPLLSLAPSPHQQTSSQQSLNSQHVIQPSDQYSQQLQGGNPGMFNQAHGFAATGAFVDGDVGTVNIEVSNQFMEKLLEKTILGAAFDSSTRFPPPRCHAGTRLAILDRCLQFIANPSGKKKARWVVGAAGVGKSAIMQSVAESPKLRVSSQASIFFSINGRDDGTKAIITISYQLAANSEPYRHVIEYEIAHDPSLLQSSMPVQFMKLIVEPFVHHPPLSSGGRVLIIIDGLDECSDPLTQQELLRLISNFCIDYPSSPIVWLIASRPETHITAFFSRAEVASVYEKEEILVDSDEARADVERFLRDELTKIKIAWGLPDAQWPKEEDFWKIASASGGLFAYAQTVTRYIGDSTVGSPVLQLSDVLDVIDKHPMTHLSREEHPMALLDALYARILAKVPPRIMIYTRKLLLALASDWDKALDLAHGGSFVILCNWLGITPDEAYAAINHLHSVVRAPKRGEAHWDNLEPFHKSFIDYISDFSRSRFCRNIHREAHQLKTKCSFRTLNQAPDGVNFGDVDYRFRYGTLRRGPGTGNAISLTWLVDKKVGRYDDKSRLDMFKLAIGQVMAGMRRRDPIFLNRSCIRLLATRFETFQSGPFPHNEMFDLVFDDSRRNEFMMQGPLKQISLKAVNVSTIIRDVTLRFRRPATTKTNLCDPWNLSCQHKRDGEWKRGKDMDWVTTFSSTCSFCFPRLGYQLERWNTQLPDHVVPVLVTSTKECCVEVRLVDSKDGVSEWTYQFWFKLSLQECEKYGISE